MTLPLPPAGLVVALQYWHGDRAAAMRLARLIAAIEPAPRRDVTIAFARRFDLPDLTADEHEAAEAVRARFPLITFRSRREGTGHPDGANALAAGTMQIADRSGQRFGKWTALRLIGRNPVRWLCRCEAPSRLRREEVKR